MCSGFACRVADFSGTMECSGHETDRPQASCCSTAWPCVFFDALGQAVLPSIQRLSQGALIVPDTRPRVAGIARPAWRFLGSFWGFASMAVAAITLLPDLSGGLNFLIFLLIALTHQGCDWLCEQEDERSTAPGNSPERCHPLEE